jgi:hypothetical protein
MRWRYRMACSLLLAACGGGGSDSTSPPDEPRFPDVAGVYAISGGFDGFTRREAGFNGTLVIRQASRDERFLDGTLSVVANFGGRASGFDNEPIREASVRTDGSIEFHVGSGSSEWRFTGDVSGTRVTGRHTLTGSEESFPGDWTGERAE